MSQQVVIREPVSMPIPRPQSETDTLIHIIERAARDPSVDMDKLERLMEMHERIAARAAKTAFSAALAEMQTELPEIQKRGKIEISKTSKPQLYALWEDINEAIKPVLSKHGFSLGFRTGRQDNIIIVTGILRHKAGHEEETTMHLPIDASGSKNAVQAVGSSTSYGKRYTAAALLNLTARGEDDDAAVAGMGETISDDQLTKLRELVVEVKADVNKFCAYLKVPSLADLPASKYQAAVAALNAKRGPK